MRLLRKSPFLLTIVTISLKVPSVTQLSLVAFVCRRLSRSAREPTKVVEGRYLRIPIAHQLPAMDAIAEDNLPLSKNKLKKLKRDQDWEANRDKRKATRKEKQKEKKHKNRAAREDAALQSSAVTEDTQKANNNDECESRRHHRPQPVQLPITLVIDCGFDDLMVDAERRSLGAQITRCYSDNNHAPYKAHLVISSFGGDLKERFDNLLEGHHRSWKGVKFIEEDFVEAANQAGDRMRQPNNGRLAGALAPIAYDEATPTASDHSETGEVVYLTSDSPNTLSSLSPYSTYIVGGIVDKNRHKGICYKKAMDRNVKTAKLPIGDYMQMSTRAVLATNHVVEIMLQWLECGDWGEAFLKVMPKRKGGVLKSSREGESNEAEEDKGVTDGEQQPGSTDRGKKRKAEYGDGEGDTPTKKARERSMELGLMKSSENNASESASKDGIEVIHGKAIVTMAAGSQKVGTAVTIEAISQPIEMSKHGNGS